jgi:YggT family protein
MVFVYYMLQLYSMLIFIRILMSWVPLDPRNPFVETIGQITDPYLNIFRRIIPPVGMMDFSPIVALLVLSAIARVFLMV